MTSQKIEKYLHNKSTSIIDTNIAEQFQQLESFYINKLWNQLSELSHKLLNDNKFVSTIDLNEFYECFIKDFEHRIHPLNLVELIIPIAEYKFIKQEKQEAFDFLKKFEDIVKKDEKAMTRLLTGEIQLYLNDLDEKTGQSKEITLVRNMVVDTEERLNRLIEVGPVHTAFYKVSAAYQRQVGNYGAYYVEALRYLGCEDLENLKMSEREEYALLLCVAALLGEGVYNFGELLAHPVLEALMGGPKEWIVNALYALNAGDWDSFIQFKDKLESEATDISANMKMIEEKLRLLCLMEMAARHPPKQRNLSFDKIAKTAHLEENLVELLVMKALANELIQGKIDQISQVVNITWVQPRALSSEQISAIENRMNEWQVEVNKKEQLMERNANDIIVAYQ
ncbi:PCI domain-containing protein [Meloidogyne graminicola]|uniref:26S proteasome non-ATPase regulatory subunit 13 n=1 Tax=Meloidogyne graminicola TaxID=189291 RepID=A0A8S9ZLG3_9BILA|nr:PCI domain-containing protein [Meloidogyne graminicola]